jgi:hypothetical protein
MTCVIIGKIEEMTLKELHIRDEISKELHLCVPENEEFLDLEVGTTGVFMGSYYKGKISVRYIHPTKFVEPLYETDLFTMAGGFTFVPPINDPFSETYLKFIEEQKNESIKESAPIP